MIGHACNIYMYSAFVASYVCIRHSCPSSPAICLCEMGVHVDDWVWYKHNQI